MRYVNSCSLKLFLNWIFVFLLSQINYICAQQDTTNKKIKLIVKTDILIPVIDLFDRYKGVDASLTFEKGFNYRHSIQLTGLYAWVNSQTRKYNTIQIIPEYKFYWNKKQSFSGLYSGVYLKQIIYHNIVQGSIPWGGAYYLEYKEYSAGGGFIFGYQTYIKKRIVVDFLSGFGARYVTQTKIMKEINLGLGETKKTWLDLRLAFNVGYKF